MDFKIKTYLIPIKRDGKETKLAEVVMDALNFVEEEDISIDYSSGIVPVAKKISTFNAMQLNMAELDSTIDAVEKKLLCKIN